MFCDLSKLWTVWVDGNTPTGIQQYLSSCVTILKKPEGANEQHLCLQTLRRAIIPEGVTYIGEKWFSDSKVESVVIPPSVKEIRNDAFYMCKNLKEVVLEEKSRLKRIGEYAFS